MPNQQDAYGLNVPPLTQAKPEEYHAAAVRVLQMAVDTVARMGYDVKHAEGIGDADVKGKGVWLSVVKRRETGPVASCACCPMPSATPRRYDMDLDATGTPVMKPRK